MKRPNSSDSMAALISICPNSTGDVDEYDEENGNPVYGGTDFQAALQGLDEEEEEEGCGGGGGRLGSEKKRRLGAEQVKALEKNFEVESKLEPERKVKLARELGLQPRQVAVWFQNRRARWKTKQLERDYGVLKASHDALKQRYQALQRENESLLNEIKELKWKMNIEGESTEICVKEEQILASDTDEEGIKIEEVPSTDPNAGKSTDHEFDVELNLEGRDLAFGDLKDGSSDDSDSSAILNNEDNNNCYHHHHHQFLDVQTGQTSFSSYMDTSFQFVKIEEHSFIDEESCSSLFSDDQAPTLHWYSSDDWN